MKLYRPGDKSRAICTLCGSVVPTTLAPRDVPFSDGAGSARGVLAATCDHCGSVVAVPAQSTPAITAARGAVHAPDPEAAKPTPLDKKVMSLLGVSQLSDAIRIMEGSGHVVTGKNERAALTSYLSGQTLAQVGHQLGMRLAVAQRAILVAAGEIGRVEEDQRIRAANPSINDNSILSRLSVRTINSLREMGLGTDKEVIVHLGSFGGEPFKGVRGVGRVTRREVLEAYSGLF